MELSKKVKDILVNKFPNLNGKSDNYILGFLNAFNKAVHPIEVPAANDSSEDTQNSQSQGFNLPSRIKGGSGTGGSSNSTKDFGYKRFKDDSDNQNKNDASQGQPQEQDDDKKGDGSHSDKSVKKKKLNIGDRLSKDEEEIEDQKRKEQIDKEKAEGSYPKELENNNLDFDSRAKAIKDILLNPKTKDSILQDINRAKDQEYSKKQENEVRRYESSPLRSFVVDLNRFIKNLIDPKREDTWSKPNKTYYGTGVLRPGKARSLKKNVPLINVYYDQSGSWGPDDIAVGNRAISTLADLQRQGKIKIKIYYFSDIVTDNINDKRLHSGTDALPEIVDHIKKTGCDNVIILTDADTDYSTNAGTVTVPGAFYLLWRNKRPTLIFDKISGKKHNAVYNLTNE